MREYAHLDEQHRPFAASIADGDKGVGRVLNAFKELGLEQNTIVLFSRDNGPEFTGSERQKQLRGGYGTCYGTGPPGDCGGTNEASKREEFACRSLSAGPGIRRREQKTRRRF